MPNSTKIITSQAHAAFQAECHATVPTHAAEVREEQGKRLSTMIRRSVFRLLGDGRNREDHQEKINGASLKHITIFRYDAVGDYIVTTALIRWLRQAVPDARIDVIASQRNEVLARADPHVDRVFTVHHQQMVLNRAFFNLLRTIGPRDSDLLFALPNRMTRCAVMGRIITPHAEKITLLHWPRRTIYGQVFHRQLDRPSGLEHLAETFLRMATETIDPVVDVPPQGVRPYLVLDEAGWRGAESFMRSEGLGFSGMGADVVLGRGWSGPAPQPFPGKRYCVVNISAHCRERQWGPPSCAAAVRALVARDPGVRIYITGAPADVADVRQVVADVGHSDCVALSLRLNEFTGFVTGASLVVSPDTATVHIAAAAGCPVVGLYGEHIKAAEWYPFGTRFILLVSASEETIDLIEPDLVADAACALLREEPAVEGAGLAVGGYAVHDGR